MSYVTSFYHIVISTKNRKMTIDDANKRELYKYIYGIITGHNCKLLWMNGIRNHIHLLINLHSTVALATLLTAIKSTSSRWIKDTALFPYFEGWGNEYYASSVSYNDIEAVKAYIKGQEEHHYHKSFDEELEELIHEIGQKPYMGDQK